MDNRANVRAVITADDRASGVLSRFGDHVSGVGGKIASTMKVAATAFAAAGVAATGFAIKSAAEFEQTRIGLENMLGSADKARKILRDVSQFAAETPFEFPELAQATRQLVAFGFTGEGAFKTMKQLGDVSAAVGAPINDLAYLMGTLRAQGRAFTIDIRQFAMRGIPIYEYLAKVFKTNTQEVTELIEAGKVGFPEVQKAFQMMTTEGGKFHGTMAKQSKSLTGLWSTLKDVIGQTARQLVGINQEGDVAEGSLFARLRDMLMWLTKNLPNILNQMKAGINSVLPTLKQWAKNIADVATAIAGYLGPKLAALWTTLSTQLIPALTRLWQEVGIPLARFLGTALVVAIGLVIDALNLWYRILTPVINWMASNKSVVYGFAAAFAFLKLQMMFNKTAAAFQLAMSGPVMGGIRMVMAGIGANGLRGGLTSLKALIGNGGAWRGAFQVGLIAAAVWASGKIIETTKAIVGAYRAVEASLKSAETAGRVFDEALASIQNNPNLSAEQKKKLINTLTQSPTGSGAPRHLGGPVTAGSEYLVGERGPEKFVPRESGTIVPNHALRGAGGQGQGSNINLTVNVGAYTGTEIEKRKLAHELWRALMDMASSKGMSPQDMLGLNR